MIFVVIFSLIGLVAGGLRGLLVGGLIGLAVRWLVRLAVLRGLRAIQHRFIDSTFATVGAVAKADGVVSPDEIRVVEQLFDTMHLTNEKREAAKNAFRRGKAPDFDLDAEVDSFAAMVRHNHALIQFYLLVLLRTVLADGEIHEKEHEMILRIARRLGLSEGEVAQLEATMRSVARGEAGRTEGPPPQQCIDDAYAVLGVAPGASQDEIKRAYRRQMAEHHPDRLAAKGLPDDMRALAEERARQINAAYELLKNL